MNPVRHRNRKVVCSGNIAGLSVLALALCSASPLLAQDWSVDWYTIDGGGEILAETEDGAWQVSGTIGQPDATELLDISGSGWSLTGGFWPVNIGQTDQLFADGFEGEAPPVR